MYNKEDDGSVLCKNCGLRQLIPLTIVNSDGSCPCMQCGHKLFHKPLPVADGEGEKVGEFQQIFSYECGCGWRGEWDKLISKHGGPSCPKCGIVLSEGQPAQGKE